MGDVILYIETKIVDHKNSNVVEIRKVFLLGLKNPYRLDLILYEMKVVPYG